MKCLQLNSNKWSINDNCEEEKYFFCEHETDVTLDEKELQFDSNAGFVELKSKIIDHDNVHINEVNLEFSTVSEDGVLMWQGEWNGVSGQTNDFLVLFFKDGYLRLLSLIHISEPTRPY